MKWFLDRPNTVRISTTIAILVGIALVSCGSLLQFQSVTRQVRYRRHVISQLEKVLSSLKDAETGQRGYLLTGKPDYLRPYQTATAVLNQEMDVLEQLIAAEPLQQKRVTELERVTDMKLAELEQTIQIQQTQGTQAALEVVDSDRGKQLMDQIRTIYLTILNDEQSLLNTEVQKQEKLSHLTNLLTIGGILLELVLVIGIILKLNQETQNLKKSQQEVTQNEQRYRSLVTATAHVVWLADASGHLQNMTPGWSFITGQSEQESQGTGWLAAIHPDDRARVHEQWQAAIAKQEFYEVEYQLQVINDNYRDFCMRGVPVLEGGVVHEWVGTCVDITTRKQAERFLKQSRDDLEHQVQERTRELTQTNVVLQTEISERLQAEQALAQFAETLKRSNQELEQFAYVASHDLQEPLRAVANYTQLLARKYNGHLDEKADKYIGYIVDGATRMQQLINDLLSYSRIGRQTLNLRSIDFNTLVKRVLDDLHIAIADCGAVVTTDPLPTVVGDATQLTQLLQNLVGNAIKYRNQETPKLHISARQSDDEWIFSVKDNGIGIDPQYADRIFIIFQRLHTRRDYSGTGIGLAICKKIVELHQGRIWVESQVGQGSIFYFTLPATQPNVTSSLEEKRG
jgi:PAS domain S-box-containing protein